MHCPSYPLFIFSIYCEPDRTDDSCFWHIIILKGLSKYELMHDFNLNTGFSNLYQLSHTVFNFGPTLCNTAFPVHNAHISLYKYSQPFCRHDHHTTTADVKWEFQVLGKWHICQLTLSPRYNGHFSRQTWVSWYQNVSILDSIGS